MSDLDRTKEFLDSIGLKFELLQLKEDDHLYGGCYLRIEYDENDSKIDFYYVNAVDFVFDKYGTFMVLDAQ